MNRYRMMYRPAGFATLPGNLRWDYVEAPQIFGLCGRRDLPPSRHTFGVIETDRPLTAEEMETFEIVAV
jgi:hypothetical protein